MRNILLISATAALASSGAMAQEEPDLDFDYGFDIPELATIQVCAIEEATESPVPFATISVEYTDTVIKQTTDEKGLLDFTPLEFPLTLTASGEGMMEASYGIFEQPEGPLKIIMTREPAEERKELSSQLLTSWAD